MAFPIGLMRRVLGRPNWSAETLLVAIPIGLLRHFSWPSQLDCRDTNRGRPNWSAEALFLAVPIARLIHFFSVPIARLKIGLFDIALCRRTSRRWCLIYGCKALMVNALYSEWEVCGDPESRLEGPLRFLAVPFAYPGTSWGRR